VEIDQIYAFLTVAKKGSFSKAALELFRTQPAISIKLRSLERELGHQLLERRPRGLDLTPAGEILYRRGQSILDEIGTLRTELSDLTAKKSGRVALGASDTVSLYLLPQMIKQFVQRYPGIELILVTQVSRQVVDRILSGDLDIGIVTLPVPEGSLEVRELYRDQFVLVFPPGHPLATRRRIRASHLRGHPIIHLKPETFTRQWIDGKLAQFGLGDQVRLEVSTIEIIKRLVETGMGISLLPEMAIEDELRSGRLCAARLQGVPLIRTMALVNRKGKYFSHALRAFVDDLLAYTNAL
jgi:DNA-binding transcriptional LysR family regulator